MKMLKDVRQQAEHDRVAVGHFNFSDLVAFKAIAATARAAITSGGVDVVSRTKFKQWAAAFMAKINDLQFEVSETFQNEDGSRVASRWRITGENNNPFRYPGRAAAHFLHRHRSLGSARRWKALS